MAEIDWHLLLLCNRNKWTFTKINYPSLTDVKKDQDEVGTEEYLGRFNH